MESGEDAPDTLPSVANERLGLVSGYVLLEEAIPADATTELDPRSAALIRQAEAIAREYESASI